MTRNRLVYRGLIVAAMACAVLGYVGLTRSGPRVTVFDARQSITFSRDDLQDRAEEPTVAFHIKNTGDTALRLGDPAASCGCTVLQEFQRVLAPGETAEVSARVAPPVIGEREVQISIPTNCALTPLIELSIAITVDAPVPVIVKNAARTEWRRVKGPGERLQLQVETIESKSEPAWICGAESDAAFLRVSPATAEEEPCSIAGTVRRRYTLQAEVTTIPEFDRCRAFVYFLDREGERIVDASHSNTCIYITFEPAFRVSPSKLYARWIRAEPAPEWTVRVWNNSESGPPSISKLHSDVDWLSLDSSERSDGFVDIVVQVNDQLRDGTSTATIRIELGDETGTEIEVPVTVASVRNE